MDDGIERPDWGSAVPEEIHVGHQSDGIDRPDWAAPKDQAEETGSNEESNPFHEQDADGIRAASAALHDVWGSDFNKNLDSVKGLLSAAPKPLMEAMLSARYDDGSAVANDPAVLRWLASLVPQSGTSQARNQELDLHSEIALIESKMGTKEYVRDESMQARLRSLYAARGD